MRFAVCYDSWFLKCCRFLVGKTYFYNSLGDGKKEWKHSRVGVVAKGCEEA